MDTTTLISLIAISVASLLGTLSVSLLIGYFVVRYLRRSLLEPKAIMLIVDSEITHVMGDIDPVSPAYPDYKEALYAFRERFASRLKLY